jgi:hypothetical protein
MVRDMGDARALFPAVALFPPVSPVSLEPGIGDTLTAYQRCVIPHEPALFMTVRREIAEPRRETDARSREGPMRTRAVR